MEIKWTDRQYHVQYNADISHKYLIMYCNTNQFPALPFFDTYYTPHGARGVSKHYQLRFDTKLGNGVRVILCITFACAACTSMLDKPWISLILSDKKERYKSVTNCTYWPLLGSLKN